MLPDFAGTRGEVRGDLHNHWLRSGLALTAPQGSDARSHRQFPAMAGRIRKLGLNGRFGAAVPMPRFDECRLPKQGWPGTGVTERRPVRGRGTSGESGPAISENGPGTAMASFCKW